jgi:hypothetical protein
MNYLALAMGLIFGGLIGGTALAQNTVGELMAAGGKQLSKDEVLAALRGATTMGPTAAGGESEINWKEDGTVSGTVTNAASRRGSGSVFGTWTVNDTGKVCQDITVRYYESSQFKNCFPVYGVADQIYVPATGATDPSARILKRTIKH